MASLPYVIENGGVEDSAATDSSGASKLVVVVGFVAGK